MPALPTAVRGGRADTYSIAVRQFRQQILPPGLPSTTVWGYGSTEHPGSFSYPSMTINAQVDRPVRVTWTNELIDARGDFLPHLLRLYPARHWANPAGGIAGRDSMSAMGKARGPYTGPVPMVVHLHGADVAEESDGHPEAWYLPVARDLPDGYATAGRAYDEIREKNEEATRFGWAAGAATYEYGNHQPATAAWFHDHTLGITAQNVYAGPAGLYLLRGGSYDLPPGVLPGPAPAVGDGPDARYYEVPLVVQDRSFDPGGGLVYPSNPDFLANTIVVNGSTWPVFTVEQRRYRLRVLNACNARGLFLKIATSPIHRPAAAALPFWLIGTDGGFLPRPQHLEQLIAVPGQRADTIVDFTDVPAGTELYLINEGPDGRGSGGSRPPIADPHTTGQVLKFVVGPRVGTDRSVPPDQLRLPAFRSLADATRTRRLSLNDCPGSGEMLLGTIDAEGRSVPLRWDDPVTESPTVGSTEVWEVHNRTGHAHPIHLHGAQFQLVGRGPDGQQAPYAWESGHLDTAVVLPHEIARLRARFDRPGRFAWHCHILEHEDNGMMRPYQVIPRGAPETGGGATSGVNVPLAVAGVAALSVAAAVGSALARDSQAGGE